MSGSPFSGRKVAVGIAKESVRGTGVNPAFWLGWTATDLADMGKNQMNKSAINVLDENQSSVLVEQTGGGKIDGIVPDQGIGLVLYSLFGGYASALHAGETLVHDHTFTENQSNQTQSVTLTRKDPNVTNQFALSMLKSLSLDVVAGDYVKFSSDWITQPSTTATVTPAFVQENNFIAKNATLKFATTVAGLGAATPVIVKDVKLNFDKKVNPYFVIGQNNPNDIFAEGFTLKGDMTLLYTDDTYKNYRFNNTPMAALLDIKNTAVTIGTTSSPELQLQLSQAYFTDWKPAYPVDGMVEQTVTFEGTFSISSGYEAQAILTNLVTTY